eukprot:Gregarina_sp_Pseudo_9__5687@NODE_80_length_4505_cov_41_104344_g74_i0_p1_GENE_NODE_80_length_4505_cov_41_104344_g74_i0NODE_80_length_4505_cov_41_104344_g74_i0_p1_ORF_typecomplete_len429_score72_06MnmE_helical/PF12631_7/0_13MCU/PF04678_13/4_3e03MCU/PF04678_13/0_21Use1/PF09753_9/0_87Dynamin_M/PF01031_20/0_85Dynamin_M/PF01031_20/1_5e02_NODE_80_length_4505_cov_41_104344_g74_i025493835
MHDLTGRFRSYAALVQSPSKGADSEPESGSPLDKASLNILKLAQTCITELNKLTPAVMRSSAQAVPFRSWINGLLADCAGDDFIVPMGVDFGANGLPPTSSDIDSEIQNVKAILNTISECIAGLEAQVQRELVQPKSTLSFKSHTKSHIREQRVLIIEILKSLRTDLADAIGDLELRTLSWQVTVKQVFNPNLFSMARLQGQEDNVIAAFRSIRRNHRRPPALSYKLDTDNETVNKLVETNIAKITSLLESEDWTPLEEKPTVAAEEKESMSVDRLVPKEKTIILSKAIEEPSLSEDFKQTAQTFTPVPMLDSVENTQAVPAVDQIVMKTLQQEDQQEEAIVLSISSKVTRISELMTTFATKVMEQQDLTENILNATEYAIESMQKATKELNKTLERKWSFRTYLFFFYLGTGCFLLLLDLITSWRIL